MGILDIFKKKQKLESSASQDLPEFPVAEEEPDLPPLPEIRMEPDLDEPIPEELPELPEINVAEPTDEAEETENIDESEITVAPIQEAKKTASAGMIRTELPAHVFVSTADYQRVMDGVSFVKTKIDAADENIKNLNNIKIEEGKQIESMRSLIEDVQRKITYVDEVIFQAE